MYTDDAVHFCHLQEIQTGNDAHSDIELEAFQAQVSRAAKHSVD